MSRQTLADDHVAGFAKDCGHQQRIAPAQAEAQHLAAGNAVLAARQEELDGRLQELSAKHYLSEPEQLEEVTIKKQKLAVKDQIARLARIQSDGSPSTS